MTPAESVTSGELNGAGAPYSGLAMRNVQITCGLIFLAVSSLPLHAADSITVNWNQICQKAGDLIATTVTGETVAGFCVGVTVNEISIQTPDRRIVKVARDKVAQLITRRPKGHQLRSLAHNVRTGLRDGFHALFTTDAVVGIVEIPGTLAWGAISAPFCLIGDLAHMGDHNQEIKVR